MIKWSNVQQVTVKMEGVKKISQLLPQYLDKADTDGSLVSKDPYKH